MNKIIEILQKHYQATEQEHKYAAKELEDALSCSRIDPTEFAEGMAVVHFPSNMKGTVQKDGAGKLAFNFQGSFFPITLKNVVRYGGKTQ